jgi:hypothetical protein
MSTYFSKELTAYLEVFQNGKDTVYVPGKNVPSISIKNIVTIKVPVKDHVHLSSFP